MSERFVGLAPFPASLDQFEQTVGLSLYADKTSEALARSDPGQLERNGLQFRHELYMMVQHALADTVSLEPPMTEQTLATGWQAVNGHEDSFRERFRPLITHVRGELMEADEGLKTAEVRTLEAALRALPQPASRQRGTHNARNPVDMLPAHMTTLRSVARMLNIARTDIIFALEHRHIQPSRMALPGPGVAEYVLTWATVERLEKDFGFITGREVVFPNLPTGPEDTSLSKEAYARSVHHRFVPHFKLTNIPGLLSEEELAVMRTTARPYHLTVNRIEELLGGGYHFAEDYIAKHGIELAYRIHPRTKTVGEFIAKEDAAKIWRQYLEVPSATAAFKPLVRIAQQAGISRSALNYGLSSDERAVIRAMRAQSPKGRVLDHLPTDYALAVEERYTRKAIPPHRVPLDRLSAYLPVDYTRIAKRVSAMGVYIPKLPLLGSNQKRSCGDWPTVRCLEILAGRDPDMDSIDYEAVPLSIGDTDPQHIAYARRLQASFGLERALPTEQGQAVAIGTGENFPDLTELDSVTRAEIRFMARQTGFTELATVRLLAERQHLLQPGILEKGLSELQTLAPPAGSTRLRHHATIRNIDEAHQALNFLKRYRGQFSINLDHGGYPDVFIPPFSAEMLQRQTTKNRTPVARKDWVHVGQVLPGVDATLEEFNDWIDFRGPRRQEKQWLRAGQSGPVLLHYSLEVLTPFILSHKRQNRGGLPKRGER